MRRLLFILSVFSLPLILFPQQADSGVGAGEIAVSYDYSNESLGTIFETATDGYVISVKLFRHPEEYATLAVRVWEKTGNGYTIIAGPFNWNLNTGPQGWLEYEFPYPIGVFKGTTYDISFENAFPSSPSRSSNDAAINSDNLRTGQAISTESGKISKPSSWFINTSGRIKIHAVENVKYDAGSIGKEQDICYNTKPSSITQITPPTGGNGRYVFQWQSSTDNKSWSDITGAKSASYSPSALTRNTWFRRNVTSGTFTTISSNTVYIAVRAEFTPGSAGSAQNICFNDVPSPLVQITAPSGGKDNFIYQWQSSTDNTSWNNIEGASAASYTPPAMTVSTWFRRSVASGDCGIRYSNSVLITVNPALSAGTTGSDQTICYNSAPSPLTQVTAPSGGTGTYVFQWQRSSDNSVWTIISGATLANYTPGTLISNTWFRRIVTSGSCRSTGNPILITVNQPLTAGSAGEAQAICYNTAPAILVQTTAPTGGTGSYTYQWQRSADNSIWTNISGATSSSYSPSALTSTTWFRRNVTSGSCGTISSGGIKITVYSDLSAGTIGTDQTVCYNESPSALTQTKAASGGTGTYLFQWQSSVNNSTWNNISGATSSSYTPATLTVNTWFRRTVTSGDCGTVNSNSVIVTVNPALTPGTIGSDQTICYNSAPSTLTQITAPTGGSGTFTYQWQSSTDNSMWTSISGATSATYSPPAITVNTWYRRNVSSGACTGTSNIVLITVYQALNAGSAGTAQSVCFNTAPDALTQITAPSGGTGTYNYQWQSSLNNTTWTNISGASSSSYSPPELSVTTWFRRTVSSGSCGSANSPSVRITVYSDLTAGTIGPDQSICYNNIPSAITPVIAPSGGTGIYTYQWQSSVNNSVWLNISGATSSSFSPSALTSDMWYRRTVTSGSCGSSTTNTVVITVNPTLAPGSVGTDQTICYNTAPSTLAQITSPTGGTGSYSYQWQRSSNNSTWTNISGATFSSYSPASLTANTWFRREVTSGDCSSNSNTVLITVLGQISAQLHDSKSIANNTSTDFNIVISGGTSPYTINYSRNGTGQTPLTNYTGGSSISTGVLTTGSYTYTLTSVRDAGGCYSQDLGTSITITVLPDQTSESNKALVIVNSSSSYYSSYQNYIKPYLDNFGIPYDVCNVNSSSLPDLSNYAVLIFGHKNVYSSGYPISLLESAVSGGVGLYSFDSHLFDYASGFNSLITPVSVTGTQVYIPNYSHYITQTHTPDTYNYSNNYVNLRGSWNVVQNSNLAGGTNLATMTSGGNTVTVFQVASYGNGRIVKWSDYGWVYENILGPVYGMDDFIWRGIVWAARKPFVMQGLPPFLTMRVDDVDGTGTDIENNFAWVSICNEFGIIPWLGLFTQNIPSSYISTLKTLIDNNKATASPHARGYATSYSGFIYYNHDNIAGFDPAAMVREARDFFSSNGLKMSNYVVPHYYEYSTAALPEIKAMGVDFLGVHWLPDLSYSPAPDWINCGPYRINRNGTSDVAEARPVYYGGYVTLSGIQFFDCVVEIRDDGGYEWFPDNSVTSTGNRGIRHLRRSFNSMVLASLFTHEQTYIASLSADNWRAILSRVTTGVSSFNPEYTTTDYAVRYIRAKTNIVITDVSDNYPLVEITYSGSNDMSTRCYLFTESGGIISYKFVTLPQVNGSNTVSATQ